MVGRRPDGFHELVSVFQALSLFDELQCRAAHDLTFKVTPALPFDDRDNLALRAAVLLRGRAAVTAGAAIWLRKRLPIAAGLGGGSADAAAALLVLQRLWRVEPFDLDPLAEQLGSDVPYFLHSPTALVRGRGELLQPLPPLPPQELVLLRPPVPLATGAVFAQLRPDEFTDGAATVAVARALELGAPLPQDLICNTLTAAAERCCPPLKALRQGLAAEGLRAHLSGSGPTLFVLAGSSAEAAVAALVGRRLGAEVLRCRTVSHPPIRLINLGDGGDRR